jgi:uncharacterized protein involved in oxidation of intracellular sulfur
VFLLGDSVTCAIPHQDTPQGYYNLERMIKSIISKGGSVDICSSCMKSRGLTDLDLIKGVVKTKFSSLSDLIVEYDKVVTL